MNENEPQNIDQSASGESAPPVDETTNATSTGNEQQTTDNEQQAAANVAPIAGDVILQVRDRNRTGMVESLNLRQIFAGKSFPQKFINLELIQWGFRILLFSLKFLS